ncbi:MAG: hypothetical protein IPL95_14680 [Saprospiraceae bacterium]|nr:hypothetical protein [Saprospiraceae bacterium]
MEKLNINLVLNALDKFWGDGEFHNVECFPSTSFKFKDSKSYQSIVKQLEKESLIERKGGQKTGRSFALIENDQSEHFDNRRYVELHLRITLKRA